MKLLLILLAPKIIEWIFDGWLKAIATIMVLWGDDKKLKQ